jgi:hypothetical protein
MDNSFFLYLERLELMSFFSAYPLVYAIIHVIGSSSNKDLLKKFPLLLPYAYAFVGVLYIGLQFKNLYPDYSLQNIMLSVQQPFLKIWAILSLVFFLPPLAKKPVFSLLHSLVFFFLLLKDLIVQSSAGGDRLIIKNDMKIYTDSLLLNLGSIIIVILASFLFASKSKKGRL